MSQDTEQITLATLDVKLSALTKTQEDGFERNSEDHATLFGKVRRVDDSMRGNGRPGVLTRLAILEKLAWIHSSMMLGVVVKLIYDAFSK